MVYKYCPDVTVMLRLVLEPWAVVWFSLVTEIACVPLPELDKCQNGMPLLKSMDWFSFCGLERNVNSAIVTMDSARTAKSRMRMEVFCFLLRFKGTGGTSVVF